LQNTDELKELSSQLGIDIEGEGGKS
jgi:hypothetical protein